MKPTRTWIVMADTRHLRIAENTGLGHGLTDHEGKLPVAPEPVPLSDEPGMTYASAGPNRGAITDPDPKGQAARAFADDIVAYLSAAHAKGDFARLILIAPPQMMGHLRKAMTPDLRAVLHAEIAKDLIPVTLAELPEHLDKVIAL